MHFIRLIVKNIMKCNYDIDFDDRDTIIYGDNGVGKTLIAREIMLALWGCTNDTQLHKSWQLSKDELVSRNENGYVELYFSQDDKKYKIRRTFSYDKQESFKLHMSAGDMFDLGEQWQQIFPTQDYKKESDLKNELDERIGLTPALMSIVMSNEQSLIGSMSHDGVLRGNVWTSWERKAKIIRDNINRSRTACTNHLKDIIDDRTEKEGILTSIKKEWIKNAIFGEGEEIDLSRKIDDISHDICKIDGKLEDYSLYNGLPSLHKLDDKGTIQKIIDVCIDKGCISEKEEISKLSVDCRRYLTTLSDIINNGGDTGTTRKIEDFEDQLKKLDLSDRLKSRKKEVMRANCIIYLPEGDGDNLVVQIPYDISLKFNFDEMDKGTLAVYSKTDVREEITGKKKELEDLISKYNTEKDTIESEKIVLYQKIQESMNKLRSRRLTLDNQKGMLIQKRDQYQECTRDINHGIKSEKKFNQAKDIFVKMSTKLDVEETLKGIKDQTVKHINEIYSLYPNWDIVAKLDNDDIRITDRKGNPRTFASGAQNAILGLAWRWMIAKGFGFPLVLDELSALLSSETRKITFSIINEKIDTQKIILSLPESTEDENSRLLGRKYEIVRTDGVSHARLISDETDEI